MTEAVKVFTEDAAKWNRLNFGNIFDKKKSIMARLNGIQKVVSVRPSNFLLNLESELQRKLEVVLTQEEEYWALKSRVNWMIQGDRNTAFYHVSTLVRRKRNQILAIKDLTGEWIHEEMGVREFIRRGFEGVYTSSHLSSSRINPLVSHWQAKLSEEEQMSISGVASEEEIKSTL